MPWVQKSFTLPTSSRGCYLITNTITSKLPELADYRFGQLTLFIMHTSCALSLGESWDNDVLTDMSNSLDRIIPEDERLYTHNAERRNHMPAKVKSSLVGHTVTIPIAGGALGLGDLQGIWYLEFRTAPHTRRVIATIQGQLRP